MSLMGNNGTFNKPMRTKLQDKETMYHIFYLVICLSGMCIHPFFYSLLVSIFMSVECWHGQLCVLQSQAFFLVWEHICLMLVYTRRSYNNGFCNVFGSTTLNQTISLVLLPRFSDTGKICSAFETVCLLTSPSEIVKLSQRLAEIMWDIFYENIVFSLLLVSQQNWTLINSKQFKLKGVITERWYSLGVQHFVIKNGWLLLAVGCNILWGDYI